MRGGLGLHHGRVRLNLIHILTVLLSALLLGSLTYCVLTIFAVRNYLSVPPPVLHHTPGISILRPLHGADQDTEENLRSCFVQDYPDFEILIAVYRANDPAVEVFERIRAEFPDGPAARLVVTGESPVPNAKAHSLNFLIAHAEHDLLVMIDSDVRVMPDMLRTIAAEFHDESVGVFTCPYRATAGCSLWSRLESIGMNTEFLGGVLVARMLEGMKFALGPTIAARREVIERMGGFQELGEFLAEDFVLGQRAAEQGHRVLLSSHVIEHRIGSQSFRANMQHRLRWARSTKRSRPAGYWGEIFTNPVPLVLLLCLADHRTWPLVPVTAVFRALSAWLTSAWVLSSPISVVTWLLLPVQDVLTFLMWIAGFFGDEVQWGGQQLKLRADGRFETEHALEELVRMTKQPLPSSASTPVPASSGPD